MKLLPIFLALLSAARTAVIPTEEYMAPLYEYPNSVENAWIVTFKSMGDDYSIAAHLETIGEDFWAKDLGIGYYTEGITAEQLYKIRTYPNVLGVESITITPIDFYGEMI